MSRILLTGATGYIGRRLLPLLLDAGHEVICLVRDASRLDPDNELNYQNLRVIEGDLLRPETLEPYSLQIDAAYYLVHSMSSSTNDFDDLEATSARNFSKLVSGTGLKQIIYLGGIVNDSNLSKHLQSRQNVEALLSESGASVTILRAAIIIGSGSASFEIIRDLVEKLPFMIAPRWLNTRCQPIAISNVLGYLKGVLLLESTFDQTYDIGGTDVLTYKQMLLGFAKVRKLKRVIITVPVLTPRLSSLWLHFVTSTTYMLARSLVDSMRNEVVCQDNRITAEVPLDLLDYEGALRRTFMKIEQIGTVSSWKDAISSTNLNPELKERIKVPTHGCFVDHRSEMINDKAVTLKRIWEIGGRNGWYYGNFLWKVRGFLDQVVGGVGLRRGRRDPYDLREGDALDFWRVLLASKEQGRLLLYAEMKLPGEAWLEFRVNGDKLEQVATFRPRGIMGRLYWYSVLPFHGLIFNGMLRNLCT